MSFPLLKQTFKANLAPWGFVTLVMNILLAQLVSMKETIPMVGPMFYGMLVPTIISLFVIIVGNKVLAGQVDQGSMAYILTTPIKRSTVAITQIIYLVGSLVVTFASMTGVGIIANNIANSGFKAETLLNLNFGSLMVALAFAGIVFLASGIFNLSKNVMGTGGLLVIVFILLAIVGSFSNYGVQGLDIVQNMTIVSLFDFKEVLKEGSQWIPKILVLALISASTFGAGAVAFSKKDLPL